MSNSNSHIFLIGHCTVEVASSLSIVLSLQGDFPWDEKDFQYVAIGAALFSASVLYLLFVDRGKEITWKDFVHRYLDRGLVSVCMDISHLSLHEL